MCGILMGQRHVRDVEVQQVQQTRHTHLNICGSEEVDFQPSDPCQPVTRPRPISPHPPRRVADSTESLRLQVARGSVLCIFEWAFDMAVGVGEDRVYSS